MSWLRLPQRRPRTPRARPRWKRCWRPPSLVKHSGPTTWPRSSRRPAEDDALEAGNDAVLASMFAGAAVPDAIHADWEQQFQSVETHATWEDEYSRALTGTDGPSGDAAPADAVGVRARGSDAGGPGGSSRACPEPEAEDAWYSGAPVPDAPDAVTDSAEPAAGQDAETPLGDFEWIPAAPTKEP